MSGEGVWQHSTYPQPLFQSAAGSGGWLPWFERWPPDWRKEGRARLPGLAQAGLPGSFSGCFTSFEDAEQVY